MFYLAPLQLSSQKNYAYVEKTLEGHLPALHPHPPSRAWRSWCTKISVA